MLLPRPEKLLDTPLANAPKPIHVNGPEDGTAAILAQLTRVKGPGNFEFMLGNMPFLPGGNDEDDEDEIEGEGEEIAWARFSSHPPTTAGTTARASR